MEIGEKQCEEDSQMGVGRNSCIFVVAKSGASGISVIHQPELISEFGTSWQDVAPVAILSSEIAVPGIDL